MDKAKSRPKTRLDKEVMILINNIWQGWQSPKITFPELEKVDVQEIRELLNSQVTSDEES